MTFTVSLRALTRKLILSMEPFSVSYHMYQMMHKLPPCPAGLAPASHPIKAVGTQRVALNSKTRERINL